MSLGYGHPLWGPEPCSEFGEVRLGDVGWLSEGRFHLLFSSMHGPDDPVNSKRGVPREFQVFVPPKNMVYHQESEITQSQLHSRSIQLTRLSGGLSAGYEYDSRSY